MHAYPVSAEVALQASPPRQIAVSKATAEDAAQSKAAAILAELHTQDLPAVLASVRGSRPKEDAERVSGLTALIGPIAPDVATLAGTYVMSEQSGKRCTCSCAASGSAMAAAVFPPILFVSLH